MLTIFNYYPKMGKTIFLNVFGACDGGMSSLIFVRANRKKNSTTKNSIDPGSKTVLPIWRPKKILFVFLKILF